MILAVGITDEKINQHRGRIDLERTISLACEHLGLSQQFWHCDYRRDCAVLDGDNDKRAEPVATCR